MVFTSVDLVQSLTPARAAAKLGVAEQTLRVWAATGRIATAETPLGRVYLPDVVEQAARERAARKEAGHGTV